MGNKMNVYELLEKLGGEIVRGKARVREGQNYVVLGQLNGDNMEFTEEGRLRAAEEGAAEEPKKRARTPKIATLEIEEPVVNSEEPVAAADEPVVVEGLDTTISNPDD